MAVTGARPGDLLAITLLETAPRVPYGVVSNRHGRGALPGEYPLEGDVFSAFARVADDGTHAEMGLVPGPIGDGPVVRFPMAPFLGILGVALFYAGDPHFAQGDGEVALTALEASLRATVRLDVVPAADAVAQFGQVVSPLAETVDHLVPTGLDEDLDLAVQQCVRHAITLLVARYGMDPRMAYAYLSAATDFEISQVVDVVKGVHARIRKSDFAALDGRAASASERASRP